MHKFRKILISSLTLYLSLLFISGNIFASNTALKLQNSFVEISENVGKAVVTLSVEKVYRTRLSNQGVLPFFFDDFLYHFFGNQPKREFKQKGMGSGFIIDKEGYILTNEHVIGDADKVDVTLPDGRNFPAKIIGTDPRSDIALIKIESENLPYLSLGNSDEVKPGQWAIAFGNPFGYVVNNPKPTITAGIVSAVHRTLNVREDDRMYGNLIQTDAAINQGNSGGPLVNLKGDVIGINTLIFSPSGGNVGIGFAIPINRGKAILNDLIEGREIKHGYLGIWLQDINREIVQQFGLSEEKSGALVFKVEKDSPAEKLKLKTGDIILKINNQNVLNSSDVTRVVAISRPGEEITLEVFRNKKTITVPVTIGERKEDKKTKKKSNSWRGMIVENITNEIAKKLGLSSKEGVVVTKVEFGSEAHQARIKPGDIIYSIAQTPLNSVTDFQKLIKKYDKGNVLIQTSRGYAVFMKTK